MLAGRTSESSPSSGTIPQLHLPRPTRRRHRDVEEHHGVGGVEGINAAIRRHRGRRVGSGARARRSDRGHLDYSGVTFAELRGKDATSLLETDPRVLSPSGDRHPFEPRWHATPAMAPRPKRAAVPPASRSKPPAARVRLAPRAPRCLSPSWSSSPRASPSRTRAARSWSASAPRSTAPCW